MPRRQPRASREPPDAEAAMEIAARFLATRPRTRHEVERRLQRAGVAPEVTAGTLRRLERLGYVDDEAFVRWWGDQRDRHSPRGRRLVEAELRSRGARPEAIEALRRTWNQPDRAPGDESLPATDAERAAEALDRHLRGRPVPDDPKALQRLGMFLMRRGFDGETVRSTLRRAAERSGTDAGLEAGDPTGYR